MLGRILPDATIPKMSRGNNAKKKEVERHSRKTSKAFHCMRRGISWSLPFLVEDDCPPFEIPVGKATTESQADLEADAKWFEAISTRSAADHKPLDAHRANPRFEERGSLRMQWIHRKILVQPTTESFQGCHAIPPPSQSRHGRDVWMRSSSTPLRKHEKGSSPRLLSLLVGL